jgi:hypothetical protein
MGQSNILLDGAGGRLPPLWKRADAATEKKFKKNFFYLTFGGGGDYFYKRKRHGGGRQTLRQATVCGLIHSLTML